MRNRDRHWLAASAALVTFALTAPALAQAPAQAPPAPQIAPSLVPSYTVDLMTTGRIGAVRRPVEDDGSEDRRSAADPRHHAGVQDRLRHLAPCRRSGLRRLFMAGDRCQGTGGTARRRPGVLHLVSHQAHGSGEDRRVRYRRRQDGVHRVCGRLCRGLGQWADAAPQRLSEPGDHPGPQHAEPRRARRLRQGGRPNSRSRCSGSTGRSRSRRRISSGSARRGSISTSRALRVTRRAAVAGARRTPWGRVSGSGRPGTPKWQARPRRFPRNSSIRAEQFNKSGTILCEWKRRRRGEFQTCESLPSRSR